MRLSSRKTLRETERWFVVSHRRGSSHVHTYMSTCPCARVYAYKTREKETWGLHHEVLSNLFTLSLPRSSWDPLVSLRVSPLSSVCPSVRTIILTECPPTATLFLQHSVLQGPAQVPWCLTILFWQVQPKASSPPSIFLQSVLPIL